MPLYKTHEHRNINTSSNVSPGLSLVSGEAIAFWMVLQALVIVFLLCLNRASIHGPLGTEHISADSSQVKVSAMIDNDNLKI